jgi:hypothetical protein
VGKHAQQVHCPGISSIDLQDLAIELFRLRQSPRSMVLRGQFESLSDREHEYPLCNSG